jgi:hypothetical protein
MSDNPIFVYAAAYSDLQEQLDKALARAQKSTEREVAANADELERELQAAQA